MFRKIFLLVTFFVYSNQSIAKTEMTHKIQISKLNDKYCMSIESEYLLDNHGTLLLNGPLFFNGNISLSGYPGAKISQPTDKTCLITSKPNTKITLNYQNCFDDYKGNLTWPLLSDNFISYTPVMVLFLPWDLNSQDWNINLLLSPLENSLIPYTELASKKEHHITMPGTTFMTSPIVAGTEIPIVYTDSNFQVDFIQKGEPKNYPSNHIETFFEILKIQNNFWKNDYDKKTTVVLNFDTELEDSVGFHGSKSFFLTLSKKHDYSIALVTFSHENFHQWLGEKLTFPGNNEFTWIMEGLTDYLGITLSQQNGLLSAEHYITLLNNYLVHLKTNPFQKYSYKTLINHSYSSLERYMVSIYRTHLASVSMEAERDVPLAQSRIGLSIKDLYYSAQSSRNRLVNESLVQNSFGKYFDKISWTKYQKMISGEQPIDLPKTLLQNRAQLIIKEVEVSDLGFNLEALLIENKIKNLSILSAAYKAGLREDSIVLGHNINLTKSIAYSQITIQNRNKNQIIQFTPNKTRKITVEQYKLI